MDTNGALPAVILPLSIVVTDMQGHYLGRVTLDLQLAQMFDGLRRAGADLGQSLLLDGRGKLLLGSDANDELSDDSALVSTVLFSDGDGHVRTAGGEYAFATLVYRSPRPLRGQGTSWSRRKPQREAIPEC
ncbi:MAG: cache domain-containing protein [Defluviicoccus sp.]|nr:MAG: cache domain-containing protein [Defluviicoccus sp.]